VKQLKKLFPTRGARTTGADCHYLAWSGENPVFTPKARKAIKEDIEEGKKPTPMIKTVWVAMCGPPDSPHGGRIVALNSDPKLVHRDRRHIKFSNPKWTLFECKHRKKKDKRMPAGSYYSVGFDQVLFVRKSNPFGRTEHARVKKQIERWNAEEEKKKKKARSAAAKARKKSTKTPKKGGTKTTKKAAKR
jgi:hypothetical protein